MKPAPLQSASLQVGTDLNVLNHVVLDWFNQFNRLPLVDQIWLQCQLALAEGFTNAVRHAHAGMPTSTPIDLSVIMWPEQLEIRIWDRGGPFDMEVQMAQLPQELNTEAEGGRGLMLMKRIATVLTYTRTADGLNCLLIMKRYDDDIRK